MMAFDVFLSHAAADRELAQKIFQRGHEADIRVYLYQHHQSPGVTIERKVLPKIANADMVVVLFTNEGAQSAYVNQEVGAAMAFERRVIALVERGVAEQRLGMLNGVEYLPLVSNTDAVLHTLFAALQKAKETKVKWLWGIGGTALGMLANSQLKSQKSAPSAENSAPAVD
jgi:hypothetical protein